MVNIIKDYDGKFIEKIVKELVTINLIVNDTMVNNESNMELIKKHTQTSDEFINNFIHLGLDNPNIIKQMNSIEYIINLEKIASWLDVRKEHLKDLLKSNFNEEEDYNILSKATNGKGKGIGSQ